MSHLHPALFTLIRGVNRNLAFDASGNEKDASRGRMGALSAP